MAALMTGHVPQARRAGDLLMRLVADQPDPGRFYYRMDEKGALVTEVPAGSELFYFVDAGRPKQIYYNPGIAMIFLLHLFRATGEETYLNASRGTFAFTERCAADVSITGMTAAREAAVAVGNYLVESQTAEGTWRLPDEELYASVHDKDGFEVRLDICSEFCTWLIGIGALI
jgi:hypothetical protein